MSKIPLSVGREKNISKCFGKNVILSTHSQGTNLIWTLLFLKNKTNR